MVRALNIIMDDSDWVLLEAEKDKSGKSWREFVLSRCLPEREGEK